MAGNEGRDKNEDVLYTGRPCNSQGMEVCGQRIEDKCRDNGPNIHFEELGIHDTEGDQLQSEDEVAEEKCAEIDMIEVSTLANFELVNDTQ